MAEIGFSFEHCFEALSAPFEDMSHVYLKGTRMPARPLREPETHPSSASAKSRRFPHIEDWDLDVLEPSGFKRMCDLITSAVALTPPDCQPPTLKEPMIPIDNLMHLAEKLHWTSVRLDRPLTHLVTPQTKTSLEPHSVSIPRGGFSNVLLNSGVLAIWYCVVPSGIDNACLGSRAP